MLTKIKNNNKTKMMAAVLAFLFSIIIPGAAFAEPGVSITDAQCTNTFQGAERTDFNITVDGLNITTDDVKFESVGDKLVCSLTINNNTDDIVEVDPGSINAESNDHIRYSLSSSTGNTIDIDAFKTFVYTVEYVAAFDEAQTFNKTLEIKLTAEDIAVPNTGAMTTEESNGQEIINIAESLAIIFGVIALIALIMRKSKKQIVAPALLAILSLSAAKFSANALHVASVTVNSKIVVSMEVLEPYADVTITYSDSLMNTKYSWSMDPLFQKYFTNPPSDFSASYSDNVFSVTGAFTGDYYEAIGQWLVDITNTGSEDAMLAGTPIVTGLTDEQKEYMEARVTYKFGTEMKKGDLIKPGETEKLLIRIQYKEGYNGPLHTNENISLAIEFPYAVANYTAKKTKDGEGWVYIPQQSNYIYSNDNITQLDWHRPSDGRGNAFPALKNDGVVVTFQAADTLDLSNAVTLDSGEKYYDLSIKGDGSLIGWYELNEDGIDYDGPYYSDQKFYDYYVYSSAGKVIVDACDYLFNSGWGGSFQFVSKMDLHGFDFERCTSSQMMFQKVGSIYGSYGGTNTDSVPFVLDLGDWTGENLLIMYDTFIDTGRNHPSGAEIIFGENWNPINLRHARYVFHFFAAETENVTVDISGWQLPNLLDASYMFADLGENSTGSITINAEGVSTPRLVNANSTFFNIGASNASKVVINAPDWTFDNATDMGYMFGSTCSRSNTYPDTICDINMKLKTPNVTDMNRMFYSTGKLIGSSGLDLSEFDTSSVTDMGEMFEYTWIEELTRKVNFNSLDTSNVENMAGMLSSVKVSNPSAESLTIDLSHLSTPSLTKASYFLSLSNIYTPDVTYTYNLKNVTIDMSNFDFSNVDDINGYYSRLLDFPPEIEKVTIYVKDQAAKDFVWNHVIIRSYPQFYYQFQEDDIVIK